MQNTATRFLPSFCVRPPGGNNKFDVADNGEDQLAIGGYGYVQPKVVWRKSGIRPEIQTGIHWLDSRIKISIISMHWLRVGVVCAVAASILTAIFHILKNGTVYQDLGADHFNRSQA